MTEHFANCPDCGTECRTATKSNGMPLLLKRELPELRWVTRVAEDGEIVMSPVPAYLEHRCGNEKPAPPASEGAGF